MSAAPDPAAQAVQAMLQAGQAWTQGFSQWMAARQTAMQKTAADASGAAPVPGLPDAIAGLQQEFAARHARLWQTQMARKADQPPVPPVAVAAPGDRRFSAPEWTTPMYDYLRQAYLINAEFVGKAAEALPVPDSSARQRLRFLTRQMIDALAPSNFAATNPEFIQTALATQGQSITAGIRNLIGDIEKGRISMTDDAAFGVGRNLAVTPGAVVFENELIQLIQYAPTTAMVAERPLVIVPPCINKFYILDLQAENSFVRHAVAQGNTVFLVSWRNPGADLGHLKWDDYLEQGVLAALSVAQKICGIGQVNALGFCVGGTLLTSALAVAKGRGEDPVASLTLLTTLLDFSDPGELGCFIDEAAVAAREVTIGRGGLMMGSELATMFSSLRPNDLIWQYVVGNYLKGRTPPAFDLLFWNSDSTNLPGPFAAWYLRNLYLNNSLRVPGKLNMCNVRIDLHRVDMPAYLLASREDHIVPWKAAYLSRTLLGGPTTFALGASGHIAGVINPPEKRKRSYWVAASGNGCADVRSGAVTDADDWLAAAVEHPGSWWPHWAQWLAGFGGKQRKARVRLGNARYKPVEPAPGRYVKEASV